MITENVKTIVSTVYFMDIFSHLAIVKNGVVSITLSHTTTLNKNELVIVSLLLLLATGDNC